MSKTKTELTIDIIETLALESSLDVKTACEVRNKLSARLMRLDKKKLQIVKSALEEGLICREWIPGKGYCFNDQRRNSVYCETHKKL